MLESDDIGEAPDSHGPNVLQGHEDQTHHLVGVDRLPQNLVSLLQEKFTAIMQHEDIQASIGQKRISRLRIGRIVGSILREGNLPRDDVKTILIHNVMLVCRQLGCEITTASNRHVKDLTVLLKISRKSLVEWFNRAAGYIDRHRAAYQGHLTRGIDPVKPTAAMPGSEEKVLMLSARCTAGLPLWNDKDGYIDGEDIPRMPDHESVVAFFKATAIDDDEDDVGDLDTDDRAVNVDEMWDKSILPM